MVRLVPHEQSSELILGQIVELPLARIVKQPFEVSKEL